MRKWTTIFIFVITTYLNGIPGYSLYCQTNTSTSPNTCVFFPLDGNINDVSGNGNNGECSNPKYTQGKEGQAFIFSDEQTIRIPYRPGLAPKKKLTIDAWVNHTERRVLLMTIVDKGRGDYFLGIHFHGPVVFSYTPVNGPVQTLESIGDHGAVFMNEWVHLSATLGDGVMAIFINDKQVARKTIPYWLEEIRDSGGDIYIGNSPWADNPYCGSIDNLRISGDISPSIPPMTIDLLSVPSQEVVEVEADITGLNVPEAGLQATIGLRKKGENNILKNLPPRNFSGRHISATIPTGDLSPGEYEITADAIASNGSIRASAVESYNKMPPFTGSDKLAGITETIPPPWTPLQVNGTDVSCWGRIYRFDQQSPFLTQVMTRDQDILAAPITLSGIVGEDKISWNVSPIKVSQKNAGLVEIETSADNTKFSLDVRSSLEFDGMIRMDVTLTPKGSIPVDELTLDIPLKKSNARLFHYYPGRWSFRAPNTGAVPADGLQMVFKSYMWLGDEDRGIAWFTDSHKDWKIQRDFPVIKVLPEGDRMILRVFLVNLSTTVAQPMKMTFGLQATPVRPTPKGWRAWRFGWDDNVNIKIHWPDYRYSKYYSFPVPQNASVFQKLIDDDHAKGNKFIHYSTFKYPPSNLPEYQYYAGDWWTYGGTFGQSDVITFKAVCMAVCGMQKNWGDFYVPKYKKYFEQFNGDGFYFDNMCLHTCNNPRHTECHFESSYGTGYVYPFFQTREMMKRIYTVIKSANPNNLVIIHMSTQVIIPILSFCDAVVDGEQFLGRFGDDYIASLNLDVMKAEMTGRQYGFIQFFLPELSSKSTREPTETKNLLTMLLLHDMNLWLANIHNPTVYELWKINDDFGIGESEFIPYWESNRYVQGLPKNILTSIYYHPGGSSALMVVGNLNDKQQTASLEIDLSKSPINLNASYHIIDAYSSNTISSVTNKFTIDIPPKSFRLLLVSK